MKPFLIVPGMRDEEVPSFVCTVPTSRDETCGTLFYANERAAYQNHVRDCAQKHRAEIEEASRARTHDGLFEPWDPEISEHMRKVGERMLREGRLVTKPNERAGF